MVDLNALERFLADPRSKRARIDGRLVVPDALVEDGVRVEHLGDDEWAEARGLRFHPWRDLWFGVVGAEELTDLEVHQQGGPGAVTGSDWQAWTT